MNARFKTIAYCLILLLCMIALYGCHQPVLNSPLGQHGCRRCHLVHPDHNHDFSCTACHKGNPKGKTVREAHKGLIACPASPSNMKSVCGRCHERAVRACIASEHFTLKCEISSVWSAFFPHQPVPNLSRLVAMDHANPRTPHGLVADLLCRRCLRCHVYSHGDSYRAVQHGLGCVACHMRPYGLRGAGDHIFLARVPDDACLSCHHDNFVGWDFYGRFDKDFDEAYRCPLVKGRAPLRPYGIEWHQMGEDIHRRAGFSCITCHIIGPCGLSINGREPGVFYRGRIYPLPKILYGHRTLTCLDCHLLAPKKWKLAGPRLDENIIGHRSEDIKRVDCAACHAGWSFVDTGRYLTLQIYPDFQDWQYLAVEGCSAVEQKIHNHLKYPQLGPKAFMDNQFSGISYEGLWLESLYTRRWYPVPLGIDAHGRLCVVRPILDLYLNYIDADDNVVFDNLHPKRTWMPYSPHTISRADVFRTLAIQQWLLHKTSLPDVKEFIPGDKIF